MKKTLVFTLILSSLFTFSSSLFAADPPTAPMLRIETGMHTAVINRIGVDAQNRFLVTGSDEKTVRVWDLASGNLLKILRPPIGESNEGKINAVAISPDSSTVAAGGWTQFADGSSETSPEGHNIYLFDRSTGAMKNRITGLPNVINHLAYSKDGKFLAATLGAGKGIRVFRTDGTPAGEDTDYGAASYWADFDADGRLVTTCLDGFIRVYESRTFRLAFRNKAQGGNQPYSAVFSPDGSKIAVGFNDSTNVDVLSTKDLTHLYSPSTAGVDNGDAGSVAWSYDGSTVFAGGRYYKGGQCPILAWSQAGKGNVKEFIGADNGIQHILPLQNGGMVFGAAYPAFGVLSSSGKRILFQSSAIADHRGLDKEGFRLSKNGKTVRFWYEQGGSSPAVFDSDARNFLSDKTASGLSSPDMQSLNITDWKSSVSPKLNGTPLKLNQYETSRSLAVSPAKDGFLLGADWSLRFFDASGRELWNAPVPGAAWDVNIAPNGKVAAAAFGDGTIRWYRVSDGKELLAFFPHNDRKRWILFTPSGYYDASPGGAELVGWHQNRGADMAAEFTPFSKLKERFFRPDVVTKVLDTLSEEEALRQANKNAGKK